MESIGKYYNLLYYCQEYIIFLNIMYSCYRIAGSFRGDWFWQIWWFSHHFDKIQSAIFIHYVCMLNDMCLPICPIKTCRPWKISNSPNLIPPNILPIRYDSKYVCCFGWYNISNTANHSHSLVLGVYLDLNDWSMLYPTTPAARPSRTTY